MVKRQTKRSSSRRRQSPVAAAIPRGFHECAVQGGTVDNGVIGEERVAGHARPIGDAQLGDGPGRRIGEQPDAEPGYDSIAVGAMRKVLELISKQSVVAGVRHGDRPVD